MRFPILLFLLVHCTCVLARSEMPPVNHPDASALEDFYNATNGDDWTENTGWLDPACDVCDWFGVTCNANNRVITLNLMNNNLVGTIPDEIANLTILGSLNLSGNSLGGLIPATINQLAGLESIILNMNDLNGPIPDVGNLGRLRVFQAIGNNLTGAVPTSLLNLPRLEVLLLSANSLSGPWPDFRALSTLRQLSLTNNQFTGALPELSQPLSNLFQIRISGSNSVSGGIPPSWEALLPALTDLSASSLQLTGPLPDISNWPNLDFLSLSNNNLSGCYPANYSQLCAAGAVTFFNDNPDLPDGGSADFFENDFCIDGDDCGPCTHPDFQALMDFYAATNGAGWDNNSGWADGAAGTDCEPCDWFGINCNGDGRVTRISLLSNGLTGTLGISTWTDLEFLERIGLSLNDITGNFPQALWFLDNLEQINMQDCDLDGNFPSPGSNPTLRILDVGGNNFINAVPTFGTCPELVTVNIANNNFVELGEAGFDVTRQPNLTTLLAQNNQFFELLPEELGDYPPGQISLLRLDGNDFQGCYPTNYDNLCGANTNFTGNAGLPDGGSDAFFDDVFCASGATCDLGCHPDYAALVDFYNSTNGDDWTDNTGWLEDCDVCTWEGVGCTTGGRVVRLLLNANNLTGTLPQSMADLDQLTSLNISNNAIGGAIPQELGAIPGMRFFRIRVNQMTGPVPVTLNQWTNLEAFEIGNNLFTGPLLRLPNSPNLTDYESASCNFTGTIPDNLFASTMVDRVAVGNNELTGELPDLFGNLPLLTQLFLQGNQLTGCYPASYSALCGDNTNFTQNPGLPDGGSDDFFDNTFCVTGQTCDGPCHPDFDALMAFYAATDGPNWTDNTGWADGAAGTDCDVCNWPGITCFPADRVSQINLTNNNLSGTLPADVALLTELAVFQVNENGLSGTLPDLSTITGLRNLRVRDNQFAGSFPAWLNGMAAMEWIDLTDNSFAGDLPDLSNLPALDRLQVAGNDFTGPLPPLVNQSSLRFLNFNNNNFSGPIPDTWSATNWPNIRSVQGVGNQLSGELPSPLGTIGDAPDFSGLALQGNQLSGCYPPSYTSFCGTNTFFSGNPGLPDGGSQSFFVNQFCPNPGVCNTLPVTWVSFSAVPTAKTVELSWTTDEETDNAGFIAERSANGSRWEAISELALVYEFVDEQPLPGESLYRIRQTDFDGTVSYSEVRRVVFTGAVAATYPNPFTGQLTVVSGEADEVRVTDLSGREVARFRHSGGGARVQNLSLPAGVYVLNFVRSGQILRVIAR